jgi:hypothetical protein
MKSYFIRQDNKPKGPYSIDQLREMKLNPAVLVWVDGFKTMDKSVGDSGIATRTISPRATSWHAHFSIWN